jgi:hypothetical protein
MADHQAIGDCINCGAGELLDADDKCPRCAANRQGYDEGRRVAALVAIGRAVVSALEDSECCTPAQVRQAVEFALDPANREESPAGLPGVVRGVDTDDYALAIVAEGGES